jgi:3-methyl-2-oxobutanoate hydroxymethyltransferase
MSSPSTSIAAQRRPITVPDLVARAKCGAKISMLTCYDASFAKLLDECGVDVLLVGDSLGMVLKGESNTLGVSVEEVRITRRVWREAVRLVWCSPICLLAAIRSLRSRLIAMQLS